MTNEEAIKLAVKSLLEVVQTGAKNIDLAVMEGFGKVRVRLSSALMRLSVKHGLIALFAVVYSELDLGRNHSGRDGNREGEGSRSREEEDSISSYRSIESCPFCWYCRCLSAVRVNLLERVGQGEGQGALCNEMCV